MHLAADGHLAAVERLVAAGAALETKTPSGPVPEDCPVITKDRQASVVKDEQEEQVVAEHGMPACSFLFGNGTGDGTRNYSLPVGPVEISIEPAGCSRCPFFLLWTDVRSLTQIWQTKLRTALPPSELLRLDTPPCGNLLWPPRGSAASRRRWIRC